jgi:hypothetical protein
MLSEADMSPERRERTPFHIELDERDIVHVRYEPDTNLKVDILREVFGRIEEVSGGRRLPVIVHMENIKSADRETRSFAGSSNVASIMALLSSSPIDRAIGNFYMFVSNPTTPTKMFSSEEDAIRWIEDHRK